MGKLCGKDTHENYGDDCRGDWFYTMPGSLYASFRRAVGEPSCFSENWCNGCGHGCLPHVAKYTSGHVSTIFDEFLPDDIEMRGLNKSNAEYIYLYDASRN